MYTGTLQIYIYIVMGPLSSEIILHVHAMWGKVISALKRNISKIIFNDHFRRNNFEILLTYGI